MRTILSLMAALLIALPAAAQDADSTFASESDFSFLYYGVAAGTSFEDFLDTPSEELEVSGIVAYETPDRFWFEFNITQAGEGESATEYTTYKVGHALPISFGLDLYAGASMLRNGDSNYGLWAFAAKDVANDKLVRIAADYSMDGGFSVDVGFMFIELF